MQTSNTATSAPAPTPEEIHTHIRKLFEIPPPHPGSYFITDRVSQALKAESLPTSTNAIHQLLGFKFIIKPNQQRDLWIIADPLLAKAYEAGNITEDVLILATQNR